jgi:glycosyltransferase involved in cell wall biosynthesis
MMDDWPSTISSSGPFKGYWHRRIDREMKLLLDKTDSHLSISQAMSDEYQSRYGKKFIPFHNPVAPEFVNSQLPSFRPMGSTFRILYLGRVGRANKRSLRIFASFVSNFKPVNLAVELDIYTKDFDSSYVRKLGDMERVKVRGPINHDEIHNYMRAYDLLLLPLDFTSSALKFSRLSIPTKASEYMISGTPILVFAPPQTAISRFFSDNECGHCVISDDFQAINTAMNLLIQNDTYREELGKRAIYQASRLFNGIAIRRNFKEFIISLLNQANNG